MDAPERVLIGSASALIYARISQDRHGEALGVQRQETDSRAYAERMGWEVVDVIVDNDTSAYSGRRRPGFEELRRRVVAREAGAVIAWRQDRLARTQLEFWQLLEDAEPKTRDDPGVSIYTADGVRLDAPTASGELTASMGITLARYESSMKRERAVAKARQKAESGEWMGGTRPFGWNVEDRALVRNDIEAEALANAVADVLGGRSLASVMREWNDPERPGGPLRTTLGKPWTYATLRQAMTRDRNTGRVVVTVGKGSAATTHVVECPPLVDEATHRRIIALLTDPSRRRSQSNKARYLLAGIAQCHCGELLKSATVTGRPSKATGGTLKRRVYRCPAKGPGHVAKRVEYVDTVAELFVFQLLARDASERDANPQRVEKLAELDAQWQVLQDRKNDAADLFARGDLDARQLATVTRSLGEQSAGIEEERGLLGAAPAPVLDDASETLRTFRRNDSAFREWRQQPIDDRRDYVRSRLHVVLHSHGRGTSRLFDTGTVRVYPRTLAERGVPLTAEEASARPPTPLVADAPVSTDGETWTDYLTAFLHHSGLGWPSTDSGEWVNLDYADGRADFYPNWRPLEGQPW